MFHYHEGHRYTGAFLYDAIVSKGYLWVEFFFCLSGFILYYVYAPRLAEALKARPIASFLAARVSRIYPLQVATLLFVLAIELYWRISAWIGSGTGLFEKALPATRSAGSFFSNLFMVQAWNIHDRLTWNAPAWFVSVEFLLYLVTPALFLLAGAKFGWRTMLLGALSVALLILIAATSGRGLDVTFYNGIFRGLAEFGVGVYLGALFVAIKARGGKALPDIAHTAAQIGVIALLLAGFIFGGRARTIDDLMVAGPIFALIFLLAFDRGLIARGLSAKFLARAGEWAFAIYMVHFTVLLSLAFFGFQDRPLMELILAVGLSVAAGAILFGAVEQPLGEKMRKGLARLFGVA